MPVAKSNRSDGKKGGGRKSTDSKRFRNSTAIKNQDGEGYKNKAKGTPKVEAAVKKVKKPTEVKTLKEVLKESAAPSTNTSHLNAVDKKEVVKSDKPNWWEKLLSSDETPKKDEKKTPKKTPKVAEKKTRIAPKADEYRGDDPVVKTKETRIAPKADEYRGDDPVIKTSKVAEEVTPKAPPKAPPKAAEKARAKVKVTSMKISDEPYFKNTPKGNMAKREYKIMVRSRGKNPAALTSVQKERLAKAARGRAWDAYERK